MANDNRKTPAQTGPATPDEMAAAKAAELRDASGGTGPTPPVQDTRRTGPNPQVPETRNKRPTSVRFFTGLSGPHTATVEEWHDIDPGNIATVDVKIDGARAKDDTRFTDGEKKAGTARRTSIVRWNGQNDRPTQPHFEL